MECSSGGESIEPVNTACSCFQLSMPRSSDVVACLGRQHEADRGRVRGLTSVDVLHGRVIGVTSRGHVGGGRGQFGTVAEPRGQSDPDGVVGAVAHDDCEFAARIADSRGRGVHRN